MPPVLCLPGLLCTPGLFDPVLSALGQGRAVALPQGDDFESLVTTLAEGLTGGSTEPVVLVGMSMGSYLALALALRVPDRVAGLVLIGTNAAADSPKGAALRGKVAAWARRAAAPMAADDRRPPRNPPSNDPTSVTIPLVRAAEACSARSLAATNLDCHDRNLVAYLLCSAAISASARSLPTWAHRARNSSSVSPTLL